MLLRKKLQALEDPLKDSISNYPSGESNRSLAMKVGGGELIMYITVTYMICPGIHKLYLLYYYYYYYTIWMSLVTGLFFLVLLLNQR